MNFILINYLNEKIEIIIAKKDFSILSKIFDSTSSNEIVKYLSSITLIDCFIIKNTLDLEKLKRISMNMDIKYILLSDLLYLFNKKNFSNINIPENKDCIFYLSLFNQISKILELNSKEDFTVRNLINTYKLKEKLFLTNSNKKFTSFEGTNVLFTGGLSFMTRAEAFKVIKIHNGNPVNSFSKNIDILICGNKSRNNKSTKRIKVENLIKEGKDVLILDEKDFLKIINNKVNNT